MEKAARMLRQLFNASLLDINMGCPVRKVRRVNAGSALLDAPSLAGQIAAAASFGFGRAVTVKIRLGYRQNTMEEFIPHLLAAKVAAITLHARTVVQGYGGQADWPAIAWLKKHCPAPVIGNGDVKSAQDAVAMLRQTGCDGVMIGRGAMRNPFIFAHAAALRQGLEFTAPDMLPQMLQGQAELALRLEGPHLAMHLVRQFIMWRVRDLPGAGELRRRAGNSKSLEELLGIADNFFETVKGRVYEN
jgi:tRNA-dihydrouridine synthase B